jgi:hypothetical protein
MKPWESKIPQTPKQKHIKRCYTIWTKRFTARTGGKVVWLTDKELTVAYMKYPKKIFIEVLERDTLEECKKYLHQTID